jgi:RHS repeat-associated protein
LTTIKSDVAQNSYGYEDEQLKSITHNGTTYSFSYNQLGQVLNAKIGSQVIAENTYNSATQRLSSTTYANGDSYTPRYDSLGRVIYEDFSGQSGNVSNGYAYANDGALTQVVSGETEKTTRFGYDIGGRLTDIRSYQSSDKSAPVITRLSYNHNGSLKGMKATSNTTVLTETKYYNDNQNRPIATELLTLGGSMLVYNYASMNRLSEAAQTLNNDAEMKTEYQYWQNGTNATGFVTKMSNTLPGYALVYDYIYKSSGANIESIKENGVLQHTYTYDNIGQLTKDVALGKTSEYAYDIGGNLLTIKENGAAKHNFNYSNASWQDQLTAFDGKALTYDVVGNLTMYDGLTYAWQKGGELAGVSGNGLTASYKYDYSGLRAEKTVNGLITQYLWAGDLLISQSDEANTISWGYDAAGGRMIGFSLNGTPYFYLRNLQGDVVGIYDLDGNIVVRYEYDAWGNILSITGSGATTVGKVNPIRYRGYYYDTETGLYYCQSRYYNPEWCRFISADVLMDTGDGVLGTNMYAYCQGNPVSYSDPSGMSLSSNLSELKVIAGKVGKTASNLWGYAKGKNPIKLIKDLKNSALVRAEVGAIFLDFIQDSKGVYHASQNNVQQHLGYFDLYDTGFDIGLSIYGFVFGSESSMKSKKFPFKSGGQEYIIWVWKGDYTNMGAGAEMGIYYKHPKGDKAIRDWLVDTSMRLGTRLTLSHKGKQVFDYYPGYQNSKAREWWITGFNPKVKGVNAKDLKAVGYLDFTGHEQMRKDFLKTWNGKQGVYYDPKYPNIVRIEW